MTAGSSAALLLVMALSSTATIAILLADPGYPCNRHFVRTLEGEPVGIPVGPATHYQLTAELIESALDGAHARRLIASPSNPTGTMVSARRAARASPRRARASAAR